MCEICRQTPCHPRCPNADEPKIIGHCDNVNCGEPLREDYTNCAACRKRQSERQKEKRQKKKTAESGNSQTV